MLKRFFLQFSVQFSHLEACFSALDCSGAVQSIWKKNLLQWDPKSSESSKSFGENSSPPQPQPQVWKRTPPRYQKAPERSKSCLNAHHGIIDELWIPISWRLVNVIYMVKIYVVSILCISHVFRYENNPQLHMPHVPFFFSLSKVQLPRWHSHHWREGSGKLRRHQSFWHWPNSRHQQEAQQAQQRSWFRTGNASLKKRPSKTNQKETSTCCWIRTCCWVLVFFVAFLFHVSLQIYMSVQRHDLDTSSNLRLEKSPTNN